MDGRMDNVCMLATPLAHARGGQSCTDFAQAHLSSPLILAFQAILHFVYYSKGSSVTFLNKFF